MVDLIDDYFLVLSMLVPNDGSRAKTRIYQYIVIPKVNCIGVQGSFNSSALKMSPSTDRTKYSITTKTRQCNILQIFTAVKKMIF